MRGLLLVTLLGLIAESGEAPEPTVYKCLVGEQHAYQSTPCTGIELKHWTLRPEDVVGVSAEGMAPQHRQPRLKVRSPRPRAQGVRRQNKGSAKIGTCAQARAARERAYSKAGLKRDFAMSSFWDNRVHEACW